MAKIPSFLFGPGTKYRTQEDLERARDQVAAMIEGMGQPGWGGALNSIGKGLLANVTNRRIAAGGENLDKQQSILGDLLLGGDSGGSYGGGADTLSGGAGADSAAGGAGMDAYKAGIAGIESGGRYDAVGPTHPKLGRALGKYQIMEANLGPWGVEAIGRPVSAEEFLNTPALQERLFESKFGSYVQKYGPEGAARAWIGGPGNINKGHKKDVLGTSVAAYGDRFMSSLSGGGGANAQAGGGMQDEFLQQQPNPERFGGNMGEIRMGPNGPEQMVETTGMQGATGPQGWVPTNQPAPSRFAPEIQAPPPPQQQMPVVPPIAPPQPPVPPLPDQAPPMPLPQGDSRFGGQPPAQMPVLPDNAAPLQADPSRFAPELVAPQAPFTPPADPTGDRPRPNGPAPLPAMMFNPGNLGLPPQQMRPPVGPDATQDRLPAATGAGLPQEAMIPPERPVDAFTEMLLGDKAKNYRPGNFSSPEPPQRAAWQGGQAPRPRMLPTHSSDRPVAGYSGNQTYPSNVGEVPFRATPQNKLAGGSGSDRAAGGAGTDLFPPAPSAPLSGASGANSQAGGGREDKIRKLMHVASSPYASPEQKRLAAAMLEREYSLADEERKSNSPDAVQDREYKRILIENASKKNDARPMTAEDKAKWGITDPKPYMMTEEGPKVIGDGAGTTVNINDQVAQRRQAVIDMGEDPNSEKWKPFVITGQKPDNGGRVTTQDRNSMRKAEDAIPALRATKARLKRAKELNDTLPYEGLGAGSRNWLGTTLNDHVVPDWLADPKIAERGFELQKLLTQDAITSMAATLSGPTTNFELQEFVKQLADPNTTNDQRTRIIDRMMEMAEEQEALNLDRIQEVRENGGMDPGRYGGQEPDAGGWVTINGVKVRKKSN